MIRPSPAGGAIRLAAAVSLLLLPGVGAAAAVDDGAPAVYQYPYTDAELETIFSQRPAAVAAAAPFTPSRVEGPAHLKVAATGTAVVRAFADVLYVGQVETCPARLWFSVYGDQVAPIGDGLFRVTMHGSWQLNWTTRAAPEDQCRTQYVQYEPVSFQITVALRPEGPVVTDGGGLPVPAQAAAIPVDTTSPAAGPAVAIQPSTTEGGADAGTGVDAGWLDSAEGGSNLVAILLAVAIVFGVGAAILLLRRLFGPEETPLQEAARRRVAYAGDQAAAEWFQTEATHLIPPGTEIEVPNPEWFRRRRAEGEEVPWGMEAPLPAGVEVMDPPPPGGGPWLPARVRDGLPLVYDRERLHYGVVRTGTHIMVNEDRLVPLATHQFTPSHQLTAEVQVPGASGVAHYYPGHQVQVMETTDHWMIVRVNPQATIVVPRAAITALPPSTPPPE